MREGRVGRAEGGDGSGQGSVWSGRRRLRGTTGCGLAPTPPLPPDTFQACLEFRWFLEVQLFALVQDLLAGFSPACSSPGYRDAAGSPR